VNVTDVPAQTLVADGTIVTLTGNNGFTVMVTVLLTAGLPVVQVSLEVSVQVTVFPFAGANV
jgi:hypothetical protein